MKRNVGPTAINEENIMEKVVIMFAGNGWLIQKENGDQYNGGRTGKQLVENCNKHGLRVTNRNNLTPELQKQLKY